MGWGLVTLDDGEPVACGCEDIDLPDHGWLHEQVQLGLDAVRCDVAEIAAIYIEEPGLPPKSGTKGAYHAGRAVQAAVVCVARRWPWAWPDDPAAMDERMLKPSEWRQLAGLPGNAPKGVVLDRAFDLFVEAGGPGECRTVVDTQDAADALLIALAGQRRNADIWKRHEQRENA